MIQNYKLSEINEEQNVILQKISPWWINILNKYYEKCKMWIEDNNLNLESFISFDSINEQDYVKIFQETNAFIDILNKKRKVFLKDELMFYQINDFVSDFMVIVGILHAIQQIIESNVKINESKDLFILDKKRLAYEIGNQFIKEKWEMYKQNTKENLKNYDRLEFNFKDEYWADNQLFESEVFTKFTIKLNTTLFKQRQIDKDQYIKQCYYISLESNFNKSFTYIFEYFVNKLK